MSFDVPVVHTIEEMRAFVRARRAAGERIGLVPTMGALHAGHLSLVEEARRHAERVIATVFVNPTQFGPGEDFTRYPRTLAADRDKLGTVAADLLFAPAAEEMYPRGFCTTVALEGPAKADLEDRFRPGHFAGVATVVAKLLNQAQADIAIFGEKDYQQLLVIRAMARDLDSPTRIVSGPTLREPDGLAMSSRNVYLSVEDRARAPALYRAIADAGRRIAAGDEVAAAVEDARRAIGGAGFLIDYVEARDALTLAPIARGDEGPIRILAAARLGLTRLIDNVAALAA